MLVISMTANRVRKANWRKIMKTDRLFLEKGCLHCGTITAVLNMEAVGRDDFRGSDGQAFLVFVALSNEASVEMLSKFGFSGRPMPLLVKADGEIVEKPSHIIEHLRQNKMTVKM